LVDLRDKVIPKFAACLSNRSRYLILYGGAGSGKSIFASQKVVLRCLAARHRFLIIRKVARTCRQSVFAEIRARLAEWDMLKAVNVNRSEMTIQFPNGSEIIFAGVDDVEKLKSVMGVSGIWIEEATELSEDDFIQIDLRLRGEHTHYKQIILSFNPISATHWLKKAFFDTQNPDATILHSTFRDNPFVGDEYAGVLARIKERSASLYKVYGDGEWGILKGLIFDPPVMVSALPEFDFDAIGIDFGFNNPTTIIRAGFRDMNWQTRSGDVYAEELLYESGLTNTDLCNRMRALGIDRRTPVWADAAEPARIQEIARHGFNIRPAAKGKNSVPAGIALLKSLRIHTTPNNVNFNREIGTYSWEEDRDGNLLDKPLELNDHSIDAFRYAVWSTMKFQKTTIGVG
jgi:phage terminase large subunit